MRQGPGGRVEVTWGILGAAAKRDLAPNPE